MSLRIVVALIVLLIQLVPSMGSKPLSRLFTY